MNTVTSRTVVSAKVRRLWIGVGRRGGLYINLPGARTAAGGKQIGWVAQLYDWMYYSPSAMPEVEIAVLALVMDDGTGIRLADRELTFWDVRDQLVQLHPVEAEISNYPISFAEAVTAFSQATPSQPITLPKLPLRWNSNLDILTDGYVSLPEIIPEVDPKQQAEEIRVLSKVAQDQESWHSWLHRLEGIRWEIARNLIQSEQVRREKQAKEAALRQIQSAPIRLPKWQVKALRQLEDFFERAVPKAEQDQQLVRLIVRNGPKHVHVIYRPGKSPCVYLFDKAQAEQANKLLAGQLHPGVAAEKFAINGRAIRKTGKKTLDRAVTDQVLNHLGKTTARS